jgi:6-phosphogluconolactonase
MKRREFLHLLPAVVASWGLPGWAQGMSFMRRRKPQPGAPVFVYFGTDTGNGGGKGIYVSRFDSAKGQLTPATLAAETSRPSFMTSAEAGKRQILLAVNEGETSATSGVSAFAMDLATGALKPLGEVKGGGAAPCYVSVDATSRVVFTANYIGGSVDTWRVMLDGKLAGPVDRVDFKRAGFGHHGPNTARQDGPHAHCATISPDNRFLVVCDLGSDDILTFPIDAATAKLGKPTVNTVRIPGSGPRHVVFHPNERWVFCINELTNTVDQYLWNSTHGVGGAPPEALLTNAGNSVSTLDTGFTGPNTAAEIAVTPDGRFLLVSNRGEDSLVVFLLEPANGAPKFLQRIACGGKTPRMFTLDPTSKWVVCAHQDSGTVSVLARNEGTGLLSGPVQTLPVPKPQMVFFG